MAPDAANGKELRILRAAMNIFARHGYHNSTISSIADEAGIAAGTIYLYFEKKEDLIVALFERFVGDHIRKRRPDILCCRTVSARLDELVESHFRFFESDHSMAAVFQIHLREVNPLIRQGIIPVLLEYFDLIDRILSDGRAEGVIPEEIDIRLARKLIFGGLDEVVTSWVLSNQKYSLMSMHLEFLQMILRAIGVKEDGG